MAPVEAPPAPAKAEAAPPTSLKPSGTVEASDPSSRDALTETEYYTGSGVLTAGGDDSGPELAISDQGQVALNFVDADIREVVDVVLGDTLGVNYVVDPQVQGTVTLRTSQPLPKASILPTLENVLKLNNVSLVESGGLFSVVPSEAAAGLTSGVVSNGGRANATGYGIHVIPLKYVSAGSLREVLNPFVGPGPFALHRRSAQCHDLLRQRAGKPAIWRIWPRPSMSIGCRACPSPSSLLRSLKRAPSSPTLRPFSAKTNRGRCKAWCAFCRLSA